MTAAEVKRILCDVADPRHRPGHRHAKHVWNIFGKTGTAHISEGKAGYSETKFNSSFIAGAPAEDPRLVIAFIIHEPNRSLAHYGGWVAAPGRPGVEAIAGVSGGAGFARSAAAAGECGECFIFVRSESLRPRGKTGGDDQRVTFV